MTYCASCGEPLLPQAGFCEQCGTPVPGPAEAPDLPAETASGPSWSAGRHEPRGGVGSVVLVAVLVAGLVLGVGGVTWYFLAPDATGPADTAAAGLTTTAATATTTTTPSPFPTPAATVPREQEALQELEAARQESLRRLVLDGRWVAQVASKNVGITDPLQVAANGSHSFYAADILLESRAARAAAGDPGSVLVLTGTDVGKRSRAPDGSPFWITLVDGGFGTADDVRTWCSLTYPTLPPAQLVNACVPRTLDPPHA